MTHFRTSKSRANKLREISDEVLVFPAMFEVRFAKHLLSSIKAILNPHGAEASSRTRDAGEGVNITSPYKLKNEGP